MLMEYYPDDSAEHRMPGYSVPTSEHSTITAWGQDREVDAYRHILQKFTTGIVSVVSDSWDIYRACSELWGKELHNYVWTGKNTGRTLVIRPDSGDPEVVVPKCLDLLGEAFGFTVNTKGYKVLPDFVRIIQGDGISRHTLRGLIEAILRANWSLENVAFGSGAGLLQDLIRDTLKFAMKCSAVKMKGDHQWREVFKQPVTDSFKNSKRGYLYLTPILTTTPSVVVNDVLRPVFLDGEILVRPTLGEVRETLAQSR